MGTLTRRIPMKAEPWIIEAQGPCFKCGEKAVQKIIIDKDKAQVCCNKCGTSRSYNLSTEKLEDE
jgi:transcription elongation factor Elf1